MHSKVLVLNASYEPLNVCVAKRAIIMVLNGIAQVEERDSRVVRSPSISIVLPVVIRLLHYVQLPHQHKNFSKSNIFIRDRGRCQYCGHRDLQQLLTLDHILPKSRGGPSTWSNLVTSCKACNLKKGNRTPDEAGMTLQRLPKGQHYHSFLQVMRHQGEHQAKWRKYLFFH